MMARTYTYTTEIEFGGDTPTACFEVTLSYTFQPASGGYVGSHSMDPPDWSTIEDLTVTHIDGKPRPWGRVYETDDEVEDIILNHIDGKLDDALIEHAAEELAGERERAEEARAERDIDDALAQQHIEAQP